MEDLFGLVILLLFWFLSAASKGKKKKQIRRERMQQEAQSVRLRHEENAKEDHALENEQRPLCVREDCSTERLHLHTVSSQELDAADEGEDPCHQGGFGIPDEAHHVLGAVEAAEELEADAELAGDLLRGIVFSEILTRPAERRMIKRNGRSA